jgi:hypothetical protein
VNIYLIIIAAALIGGWVGSTLSQKTDAAGSHILIARCERINAAPCTLAAEPTEPTP